jgi:hypothetical protein
VRSLKSLIDEFESSDIKVNEFREEKTDAKLVFKHVNAPWV